MCPAPSIPAAVPPSSPHPGPLTSLDDLSNEILMLIAEAIDNLQTRFNGEEYARSFNSLKAGVTQMPWLAINPAYTPTSPAPQSSPDYDLLAGHETHFRLSHPNHYALAMSAPRRRQSSSVSTHDGYGYSNGLQGNGGAGPHSALHTLSALSLSSRRLRSIAQPVIFRAPVLGTGRRGLWTTRSPIYLFFRTLVERPEFSRWTTSLRIDTPQQWGCSMNTGIDALDEITRAQILRAVMDVVDAIYWLDKQAKEGWKWQLKHLRPLPFCALILCLLPNLKQLNLQTAKGESINPFIDLFWMTSAVDWNNLHSLAKCPGIAHLTHVKTTSWTTAFQPPLSDLPSLTSLDMSLRNAFYPEFHQPMLNRLKLLRLRCNIDDLPYDLAYHDTNSHLDAFLDQLALTLPFLTSLETLEMYTADPSEHAIHCCTRSMLAGAKYSRLIEHCLPVAPKLRTLELPRGWWTWPGDPSLHLLQHPHQITLPLNDDTQPGAYTGSIVDLRAFTALETLVTHSTAIIAKGAHDTQVADPRETLPASIKCITVYGAHDGLWTWISDIFEYRGSHFPRLECVTLWREGAVDQALRMYHLRGLRRSQEDRWRAGEGGGVRLRLEGDV